MTLVWTYMRVRTVFDFSQIPRRYNNPKKGKSWSLMFRLMLGKPIWDLSIYIIFGKVIVFRGRFILSQSWIWSLAMFVQSTLIKKSLNISTIEVFNGQCPYLTFNVMNNWSSYITPPAIFSSMVIYCPTQTAYEILRARHTTTLPPLSTNTNTKKKQTQTQQKQTQT